MKTKITKPTKPTTPITPIKTISKNPQKSFRKNQDGKIHILLILVILLIIVVALIIKFGLGKGPGDGGEDSGNNPKPENKVEVESSITPAESPTTPPVATTAPQQFSVIVEKTEFLFDNEKFENVQSLVDAMQKQAGTDVSFSVILHDENAVANTLEDLKNALEKNGIPWATPTPAQTPEE